MSPSLVSPETMQRIRQIELRTRKLVDASFAGAYHSVFKGRGLAFESVRPYQPGDSVRDIDWNVTARNDEAYVKNYAEERELTVVLVLDSSASCLFGTVKQHKCDLAAEVGAVLALAAARNNDKVGVMVFSDQVERFIPPRKGRNHVLRVIGELLAAHPARSTTNLPAALQSLNRLLKQRAIIFLMSDFLAAPQEYARELLVLGRRHDVIAIVLSDPREKAWPSVGLVGLKDAETGAEHWVDTSSQAWQQRFARQTVRFQQLRDSVLAKARADRIDLSVDDDYVKALTAFFRRRERQLSR
ncbi:MAG: DUF58 domain-containing protein [bacterium]|nr:DUF58 domain-containing protein [bacterium]